ncbi:YjfA family protein [Streptomyces sp. RS10V-4]|uniref:DUF2690 domain-containing protein n=1 Tax=Streptomyces rhizoryzae TaxID=2932493 RepID=UPI0020048B5B|nr:DUF2690 domain-containing protein [Streptomyces rhizoryzae]MCK7622450.1 YjfA family protein [Streptomyces rhizoryzae]
MKHLAAVLLGTGALLASGLVAVPSASATIRCHGSSCNGLNPARTTCANDARTVAEGSGPITAMELRYSPSCRAAWGRFVINAPSGSKIQIKNAQGKGKQYTTYGSGRFFSVMVNDQDVKAWACGMWGKNVDCTHSY